MQYLKSTHLVRLPLLFSILVSFCLFCSTNSDQSNPSKSNTPLPNDTIDENYIIADSIVTDSVIWYFGSPIISGQFANGDHWVKGPVIITRITPDFDEEHHGWEVNPSPNGPVGFDIRLEGYDNSIVPELPYTAQPGQSLIKVVSREPFSENRLRPCLLEASVLTILDTIPIDIESIFRPPYVGEEKPQYNITNIRIEQLPSLPPVDGAPSLEEIEERFRRVRMDHRPYRNSTYMRPEKNLDNYAAANATDVNEAVLRLMLDDPIDQKMSALINVLQCGIDYYHFSLEGQTWPRGGGEQPGNKLPIVFFATLMGDDEIQQYVRDLKLYDDYHTFYGHDSIVLWGNVGWERPYPRVEQYWNSIAVDGGDRTIADPYGYIDGGVVPGDYYQHCCTSLPFKGTSLCLLLMPKMLEIWYPKSLIEYSDRWVEFGTWTQPDPCAPSDGDWDNYGITYGPDPENPSDCIRDTDPSDGIGRFPERHGTSANEGAYGSNFVNRMWEAYRTASEIPSQW